MNKVFRAALLGVAVLTVSACDTGPKGSAGFTLPDGNAEQGKENYIAFHCNACHDNAQVPHAGEPGTAVPLGGESARVRTYGELVTSVINPSHRVAMRNSDKMADDSGKSKMATYNDVMTVTQMIDLVAFVQSSYTLSPYQRSVYPVYWQPEKADKK